MARVRDPPKVLAIPLRKCSNRSCAAILPPIEEYKHKRCNQCRERNRQWAVARNKKIKGDDSESHIVYPTAQNLCDDLRVLWTNIRDTGEMFFFQGEFYTSLNTSTGETLQDATRMTTNDITSATGVKYGRSGVKDTKWKDHTGLRTYFRCTREHLARQKARKATSNGPVEEHMCHTSLMISFADQEEANKYLVTIRLSSMHKPERSLGNGGVIARVLDSDMASQPGQLESSPVAESRGGEAEAESVDEDEEADMVENMLQDIDQFDE